MRPTSMILLLSLSHIVGMIGCGAATATVSGEVTIDGKLLDQGVISYVPADGEGAPITANIQNGKYELQATPGKNHVQISAPVVVGTRKEYNAPDAPLVEITEERLPERYNSRTELTVDLQPGGNTKNWSVESKVRKR